MDSNTKKSIGVALALSAAALFGTVAASAPAFAADAKVMCTGANGCKGQSECKSASHSCKGMNSCKGQGWISLTPSECSAAGGTAQ
jgi:hypothetical protein